MNSRYSRHGRFPNESRDDREDRRPVAEDYRPWWDDDYRVQGGSDPWTDPWAYDPRGGGYVGYGYYTTPYLAPLPGLMDEPPQYRNIPRGEGRGYGYGAPDDGDRGFFTRAADEVASWFGDEDAERRRERDYRGYGPRGYTRSDDRIHEDVNDRLMDDDAVDATEVTVSVAGGEVTLDGTVPSRLAKRRAEDCADSVSGVAHVQNNLRVLGASETAQAAS